MSEHVAALERIAPGLVGRVGTVDGVVGVVLGGSRARGEHRAESDYDIGIYYLGHLDVAALQAVADAYSNTPTEVTEPGGWGPWVDGGGWLSVNGTAIDLIYRDLDRTRRVWAECQAGTYRNEIQAGHPLGFWSHAYVGELALAVILDDPAGQLAALQIDTTNYPQLLADALSRASWEASFSMANARKAINRLDVSYVAGCMFRAVGVLTQSIHGHDRRWLVNEKGAVEATGALPSAPVDFAERVADGFAALDASTNALAAACDRLESLVAEAVQRVL